MNTIRGGCHCGAIRFESESEATKIIASDCRHCHRQPGAAVAISVGIPEKTLRVRGLMPSVYEDVRPSGSVVLRSFCPECGTPLFTETDAEPTLIFIKAATLDGNAWTQPQVFYDSARSAEGQPKTRQQPRSARIIDWPKRDRRLKIS